MNNIWAALIIGISLVVSVALYNQGQIDLYRTKIKYTDMQCKAFMSNPDATAKQLAACIAGIYKGLIE